MLQRGERREYEIHFMLERRTEFQRGSKNNMKATVYGEVGLKEPRRPPPIHCQEELSLLQPETILITSIAYPRNYSKSVSHILSCRRDGLNFKEDQ